MSIKSFLIFLCLNFLALGIGGFFTGDGVPSEWYQNLDKAPWTPPGWVFGLAWTTIMICFAIYMSYAYEQISPTKKLLVLFGLQWLLNVLWNPTFFTFHLLFLSLVVIIALSLLIAYLLLSNYPQLKGISLFMLPYLTWLIIATSLNFYAWMYN